MTGQSALLAVVLSAVASCAQQPAPDLNTSPGRVREAWLRNFNSKDTDAVLALYAADAVVVSEAGTFNGREAIRPWVQASIDQGSRLESIDVIQEKSSGTLAFGTGTSRRWVANELHLGRYLIVMEWIGGEWKIVQHFSMNVKRDTTR